VTNLQKFQSTVARALIILSLVQVPVLAAVSALLGANTVAITLSALVLALLPLFFWWMKRSPVVISLSITVALVGQTSLLVYAFEGGTRGRSRCTSTTSLCSRCCRGSAAGGRSRSRRR
jgi:hypothetical protein